MAITLSDSPDVWSSAYRPIEFVLISDLQPNAIAGEVDVPILFIQQSALGVFAVISSQFTTSDLQIGEALNIKGTDNGLYVGTFRVLNAFLSSGVLVAYLDMPYVGDETGGLASRTYDNLRIIAQVQFPNTTVNFELQADENNKFTLNIQDCAARQFIRTFDELQEGLAWDTLANCDASIALPYAITMHERYTVWTNGVPSLSDDVGSRVVIENSKIKGFFAVNCIHPYHKEENGSVVMDWDSDLRDLFVMRDATPDTRFLTWGSRTTQKVGLDENFYLSFLAQRASGFSSVRVFITTYFENGTSIGVVSSSPLSFSIAGTVNVGPAVIPGGTITASVAYYTVRLLDQNTNVISETFRINIDRECSEIDRRIYWRNKMGGVDNFTMKGREREMVHAERQGIRRNYMPVPGRTGTFYGSWMNRNVKVDPTRGHMVTSELLPVSTLRWLNEDCFESADHSTVIRPGWWTPVVFTNVDTAQVVSDNVNQRFTAEYFYGVDNLSQRA